MRKELDEKLKKALGSLRPLDVERFTSRVMERLSEEFRKEQQHSVFREFFCRLISYNRDALKAFGSGRFVRARQSGPPARRYATVFKVTAVLAAVVVISTLIFIPNHGPSTPVERLESPQTLTKLNDTLPRYVLNERIDVHIEETRPCDVLPPFLN
ncbi:MAG: hypothetical protein ACYTBJ_21160 [Planctomycetota bacterium]|jgi:hypothetical protein